MNNSSLLNISSNDILKKIFSHIELSSFYNLVKYNKQIQKKLNINFKSNIQTNKYIERIEKNKLENNYNSKRELFNSFIIFGAHYVYFIAHYLINVPLFLTLNPDLYKSKDKYWNIITNIFFRIFSLFYHFFSALVLYYILSNNKSDYIYRKIIFIILTVIVIYFQSWYEIGLFHKIKLTFSFALNKKWIIFFDVIYSLLNLSFIFFAVKALYSYSQAKIARIYIKVNILYLYKNIKIKEYKFKDNFELIDNERRKISSEANNFEVIYSEDDKELIQNINDYRLEKNLPELIIDKMGKDYSNCRVSWYGDEDAISLDNDGNELAYGRKYDYKDILVGIDCNLLQSDPKYVEVLMKKLLDRKRVESYLERGMQENTEIPCGKYIGEIKVENNTYKKVFDPRIGEMSHNSPKMVEKRARRKEMIEKMKQEKIARNQDQIAKLQAEIDEMEK